MWHWIILWKLKIYWLVALHFQLFIFLNIAVVFAIKYYRLLDDQQRGRDQMSLKHLLNGQWVDFLWFRRSLAFIHTMLAVWWWLAELGWEYLGIDETVNGAHGMGWWWWFFRRLLDWLGWLVALFFIVILFGWINCRPRRRLVAHSIKIYNANLDVCIENIFRIRKDWRIFPCGI